MTPDTELWNPGRWTKAIACVVGGLFAWLSTRSTHGYGWWGSALMVGMAVAVPILQYRKLWTSIRFWITVSLLAVVQVPLVIVTQPLIEQLGAAFLLILGIVDGIFVIAVIFFVCTSPNREH